MTMVVCARILLALCTITLTQAASLHRPSHCRVNEVRLKQHFDVKQFTGKWYDVGRLVPNNVDQSTGYSDFRLTDMGLLERHYMGQMGGECLPPSTQLSETVYGPYLHFSSTDHSQGPESGPYWVVDTDYRNFAVIYGCDREERDGRCAEGAARVYVLGRRRSVTAIQRRRLQGLVEEKLCVEASKITYRQQTVECPALPPKSVWNMWGILNGNTGMAADEIVSDPEPEFPGPEIPPKDHDIPAVEVKVAQTEDKCAFVNLQSQQDFDASKFQGFWHHIYRLKWSHHKFESEVNYIQDLTNGRMRGMSRSYLDGKCSNMEDTYYTQSKKIPGDWVFDTYGGVKVLYTDYSYAIVYICDEVNNDGSCDQDKLEVEVLSRNRDAVPEEAEVKLLAAVEGACFSEEDFEEVTSNDDCMSQLTLDVECSNRPMCLMYCENGFVTGDDGCPVCDCKDTETSGDLSGEGSGNDLQASSGDWSGEQSGEGSGEGSGEQSSGGVQTDTSEEGSGQSSGSLVSSGESGAASGLAEDDVVVTCPLMMCMIECEYGMMTDHNGCYLCACNDAPVEEEAPAEQAVSAGEGGEEANVVEEPWKRLVFKYFGGK